MKKELITHRIPKSPISEIFRTLRTNLQFMNTKEGLKTLMVTSCNQGEGKSWTTANLAVAFAQTGKKVLLIDCDLRKGRQFSIFGVKPTPGISNFLSGIDSNGYECSENVLDIIQETPVENLDILTAGNVPPNPSELLVSERMQRCIRKLKSSYDLLIFDTTPSNLVTDAIIISRYVDTSIIVVEHKHTKMEDLKRTKRDIENVGGKIAGVVVNKVPTNGKKYTAAYYYYGSSTSLVTKVDKGKNKMNSKARHKEKNLDDKDYEDVEDIPENINLEKKLILKKENTKNEYSKTELTSDEEEYNLDKKEKTKNSRKATIDRKNDILNIINRYTEIKDEDGD